MTTFDETLDTIRAQYRNLPGTIIAALGEHYGGAEPP